MNKLPTQITSLSLADEMAWSVLTAEATAINGERLKLKRRLLILNKRRTEIARRLLEFRPKVKGS